MSSNNRFSDIDVVITGATSGIGAAFARQFAAASLSCLLVGRRQPLLEALASELMAQHPGIICSVELLDLADIQAVDQFSDTLRSMPRLKVLINNAGYNVDGRFGDVALKEHQALCQVHMGATMTLTYAALPNLLSNKGKLINVASLASYLPTPMAPLYGPTKSFIRTFTTNIAASYRQAGLKCISVCPGFVRTDFHEKLGLNPAEFYRDKGMIKAHSADSVVHRALRDLAKGKVVSVMGLNYRLMRLFVRHLPEQWLYRLLGKTSLARPQAPVKES